MRAVYLKLLEDQLRIEVQLIGCDELQLLQAIVSTLCAPHRPLALTTAMVVNRHVVVYALVIGGMDVYSCCKAMKRFLILLHDFFVHYARRLSSETQRFAV